MTSCSGCDARWARAATRLRPLRAQAVRLWTVSQSQSGVTVTAEKARDRLPGSSSRLWHVCATPSRVCTAWPSNLCALVHCGARARGERIDRCQPHAWGLATGSAHAKSAPCPETHTLPPRTAPACPGRRERPSGRAPWPLCLHAPHGGRERRQRPGEGVQPGYTTAPRHGRFARIWPSPLRPPLFSRSTRREGRRWRCRRSRLPGSSEAHHGGEGGRDPLGDGAAAPARAGSSGRKGSVGMAYAL